MATLILRPIGDIELKHSCSAGSNGYSLINEEVADNDGTYLYYSITSTSGPGGNNFSSYFLLPTLPQNIKILSAKCVEVATSSLGRGQCYVYWCKKGEMAYETIASVARSPLTTEYAEYSKTVDVSSLEIPEQTYLRVNAWGSKENSKDDDGYVRITQAYIEIEYEELSNTYNCAAVAKDNITSATVSDTQPTKGDSVVFTASYEKYCPFLGWYNDEACTNLVSTENPFTIIPTSDLTLYAKAGENIGCTISLTMPNTLSFFIGKGVYLGGFKQDLLTEIDYANLKAGKFSSISSEKVWEQNSATGATNKEHKTSVFVPKGCLLAMYANPSTSSNNNSELYIYETSGTPLSYISYYQVVCDGNHSYTVGTEYRCECTATAGTGIASASVDYPKLIQGGYVTFTATVMNGYKWKGWYSDNSRKTLISSDQTYTEQAPYKTSSVAKKTYLSRYAYAEPIDQDYGLYLKQNGTWIPVKQLYVKENGQWVFKLNVNSVFDTTKNYVKGEV